MCLWWCGRDPGCHSGGAWHTVVPRYPYWVKFSRRTTRRVFSVCVRVRKTHAPPHRVEIAKTALVVAQTQDGALRPHAALPRATRGPPALPGTAAALWDGVPTVERQAVCAVLPLTSVRKPARA